MHVSKYIAPLSLLMCALVAHCLPIATQRSSFPSAASASSYNASDALLAWQYSKSAYCEVSDILAWNCSACGNATSGFVPFWSMEMSIDVQVFVGYDAIHDMAVISFRGSKTLTNWLLNLQFAHTDSPFSECLNCYVHRGFLDDYNSVAVQVFVAVNQIREKYGAKRVLVTGHSLGGVLATLAAIDLKLHDSFSNVSVITFGEPRLGNAQFADPPVITLCSEIRQPLLSPYESSQVYRFANFSDFMLPDHWRLVNNHDLVPHVPPESFGFRHDSVEVWYHNGTHTTCGPQEDSSCSNSVPKYDLNIGDHLYYLNISHHCSPM
jgi:pimeloyl-ACP methyl ester carboxylesterase